MGGYNGVERRKYKRLRVDFTLIYNVGEPIALRLFVGWDLQIDALMIDLSEAGLAILSGYDIPLSTVLNLKFTLINSSADPEKRVKTMEIAGKVCSNVQTETGEYRLGIVFTSMKEDDKLAIRNFIGTILFNKKGNY